MTDEQNERLKQIRERRHAATLPANQRGLLHTASWVDIDFLLSLLDSQAALPPGEWCRCLRQKGHENRTIECLDSQQISQIAATRMRGACVEKVREYLIDCRDEERGIIEAIASELQSLTLGQVGQKQ